MCLTEGSLEHLLCRKHTKEHEAILHADLDARDVHQALILANAQAGAPVQFQPKFKPATGTRIKIMVEYEEKGKKLRLPAQQWLKPRNAGKAPHSDWVFAGSRLVLCGPAGANPPVYLANEGDVICVSNFEGALLDLPIKSPSDNADLLYEAHTERIPPVGTTVLVILEPVIEKGPAKQ